MPEQERELRIPPDPTGIEEAHDVLAAEEFGMPAPEERIPRDPTGIPGDPTGIEQPHDVLAAEEFAMPSGEDRPHHEPPESRGRRLPLVVLALAALAVALVLRRRSP